MPPRSPATQTHDQSELFDTPAVLPNGLVYQAGFLTPAQEGELLEIVSALPLEEARYKGYTARRRVASYGSQYDFDDHHLQPAQALPDVLRPLQAQVAAWSGLQPDAFSNALVAEYQPGTPLGWHRDVPDFEVVVGVSLLGSCRMRFRRYPPVQPRKQDVLTIELAPRSAYVLQGEARWGWQHSVAPTPSLRYSITFRTPVARGR
ncbi:alpha-ketoglutarate-dependent dioxygenase AlkB [Caldimonas brevitalea]|uniref:2OG-Fe(II) oxygenase n=1 Tax=Caldimonas brevitalea TaxID=413882 RepID=A0A0G3BJK4_9BURK|nr:alpha-ketoglutarate-dependent dioxygenase AlkB [Caldimonas brevitalea]AKJ26725.1 2OG-Fe(II) oxygenase [Caldimonas brevitalea]